MSAKSKKSSRGVRYSDDRKQQVVEFVNQYNSKKGRGGQAAAVKKFGVTALTISGWLAAAAKSKTPVKAAAPVKAAPKAVKAAPKAVKAAPKAVKAAPKAVKAAPKAVKAAPKAVKAKKEPAGKVVKIARKAKVPQGIRYTPEQKQAVLSYVAEYNALNGRGGMTAAARKFKVTPLTVTAWMSKFGMGRTKSASKAAAPQGSPKLLARIAKLEVELKTLKAKAGMK